MNRLLPLALVALVLAACSSDSALAPVSPDPSVTARAGLRPIGGLKAAIVTNADDRGPGSFRFAVALASANKTVQAVVFDAGVGTVMLTSPVAFTGAQTLTIDGGGATLDARNATGAAFLANGGASLTITHLTVQKASAEGIDVEVPADASGVISLTLDDVTVLDNGGHGVLLNDQVDPSTEDDVQPNAAGSAASLVVVVRNSRFANNGYTVSDRDGVRINEGGAGTLTFTAVNVRAEDNAADGIELDERGAGDILIDVTDTFILRNGKFDPDDLDDGFDIDEYDAGSILGSVRHTTASDNSEEGLDFNENNAGDLRVDLFAVTASNNLEEGIDYEEDDDFAGGGDLVTVMQQIVANGNAGDGGLKIREKGDGSLNATVNGIRADGNEENGISVREDAAGSLVTSISNATASLNGDRGVDLDERGDGSLGAVITDATVASNGDEGIRARQAGAGTGTLQLVSVSGDMNGDGLVAVVGVLLLP